jgi:hypothetical protein
MSIVNDEVRTPNTHSVKVVVNFRTKVVDERGDLVGKVFPESLDFLEVALLARKKGNDQGRQGSVHDDVSDT